MRMPKTGWAWMYQRGNGVPQDDAEAVKWFRKAAEQGHAGAQNELGLIYQNGEGVPQDYAEAVKWFRMAAEQGNAYAQNELDQMKAKGIVVDKAESKSLLEQRRLLSRETLMLRIILA